MMSGMVVHMSVVHNKLPELWESNSSVRGADVFHVHAGIMVAQVAFSGVGEEVDDIVGVHVSLVSSVLSVQTLDSYGVSSSDLSRGGDWVVSG